MAIAALTIKHFRNIEHIVLSDISPELNVIIGNNAAGKTNLLEAINFISTGRSFRTASSDHLLKYGETVLQISGRLTNHSGVLSPISIKRGRTQQNILKINDQVVSQTDLAYLQAILTVHANTPLLLHGGPAFKRKYLDWCLFYFDKEFFNCWKNYHRALKHRNLLLKQGRCGAELDIWTAELVQYGLRLDQFRRTVFEDLVPIVKSLCADLLPNIDIRFAYKAGWQGEDFLTALASSKALDLSLKRTHPGPHRADFSVKNDQCDAKDSLSKGQQKLLTCAMIFAQGSWLRQNTDLNVTYLIDDLTAELDVENTEKLINLLQRQQTQAFVTAIKHRDIMGRLLDHQAGPIRVFHVEHGTLSDVSIING